jgi:radical SAM protein with 4Fe4S-binding SPASM domain
MKKLNKVYVEITSICNLACHFCPPVKRESQFISPQDFADRLDQIKPHTNYIYLHVKGEPLLHPRIDELLDIAADKGFKVNMTTNGTLLGKSGHKLLDKPALRQINFSLHSFDGHHGIDEANRMAKADYIRSVVTYAKEIASRQKVIISFRLWNLAREQVGGEEYARNREVLAILETMFELDGPIGERINHSQGLKLADRIYLNQDYEFVWPDLDEQEDQGRGFCHALRNQAAILANGTVVPCCLDGEGVINLGNVKSQTFSEILEGERATRLYDGFSNRMVVEELCRKCDYRRRFNYAGAVQTGFE